MNTPYKIGILVELASEMMSTLLLPDIQELLNTRQLDTLGPFAVTKTRPLNRIDGSEIGQKGAAVLYDVSFIDHTGGGNVLRRETLFVWIDLDERKLMIGLRE